MKHLSTIKIARRLFIKRKKKNLSCSQSPCDPLFNGKIRYASGEKKCVVIKKRDRKQRVH